MRLATIVSAFALASGVTAWSDFADASKCGAKTPDINNAIGKFCSKKDLVVPSRYANRGVSVNGWHVAISGKCNPPQWVPFEYCRTQFARMCANGNGQGLNNKRFGRNGCQGWHIDRKGK